MDLVNVKINGINESIEVEKGTTYLEISDKFKHRYDNPILLAQDGGEIYELENKINKNCEISFLDITSSEGYRVYQRSVAFLAIYAIKKLFGSKTKIFVEHSINNNFFCEIPELEITSDLLKKVYEEMTDIVNKDIKIQKNVVSTEIGREIFNNLAMYDTADALKYVRNSNIYLYRIDEFYDYFYGPMVPSAGRIGKFDIVKYDEGFLIQFPIISNPNELNEVKDLPKLYQVYRESSKWAGILGVSTVGALNDAICSGKIKDIILISEALHEKKIANIADMITEQKKNIVLIAGPSSSGKTTFANRICTQLKVNGLKPSIISLDDYYLNREDSPIGDNGKPDFEVLEAIDVKQFNEDMTKLLAGETVQLPTFNFKTGSREYRGNFIKLNADDVLVIEGIHGLNEKLTSSIPKSKKFKIYISAITQLNIDRHNRIPTTDTRLIRRIVRDNNFRGFNALSTFDIWPTVVKGENKNIFPFQEEADIMFNSALIYELCVLKQFAEPLLFDIDRNVPEYIEAKRLIKFLDSFLNVNCKEIIPSNSIIREFIGGSCYVN